MTMFSSCQPFNDDPEPLVSDVTGARYALPSIYGHGRYKFRPRPEFTRIPHNPTNPILAEFRENVAEDSRNGMPLSESIEDMIIMCNPVFWGHDEANVEHIEHARRVLKRLAWLAKV